MRDCEDRELLKEERSVLMNYYNRAVYFTDGLWCILFHRKKQNIFAPYRKTSKSDYVG